jgi:hypothetical protein
MLRRRPAAGGEILHDSGPRRPVPCGAHSQRAASRTEPTFLRGTAPLDSPATAHCPTPGSHPRTAGGRMRGASRTAAWPTPRLGATASAAETHRRSTCPPMHLRPSTSATQAHSPRRCMHEALGVDPCTAVGLPAPGASVRQRPCDRLILPATPQPCDRNKDYNNPTNNDDHRDRTNQPSPQRRRRPWSPRGWADAR